MSINVDLTSQICNTQYAPLAALIVHYHRQKTLYPLSLCAKISETTLPRKLV